MTSMQTTKQLVDQFGSIPGIRFEEVTERYPVIRIQNQQAKAGIALHGAHLFDYQPTGKTPVIFTSSEAVYRAGKAIRGGIPVCWPWFGSREGKPSHGYARTSFWTLEKVESTGETTRLLFTLPKIVHSALTATLEFHIGETLTLALYTTNEGDTPQICTEALHTYFAVRDHHQTRIYGLEGVTYTDTVGDVTSRIQYGPVIFSDEVDRIYHSEGPIEIEDGQRRIRISKKGSRDTVVWNPGWKKGMALDDLAKEEIPRFICAECANTGDLTVAPGETHTMCLSITCTEK